MSYLELLPQVLCSLSLQVDGLRAEDWPQARDGDVLRGKDAAELLRGVLGILGWSRHAAG